MFENLLELVKSNAGDAVVNNAAVPNEKNDAVIAHASESIVDSLKQQIGSGNISDVLSTLGGKSGLSDNPVLKNVMNNLTGSLASKFGLSNAAAGSVAEGLIPKVMNQLVSKTNDPNDSSFDLGGIVNSLTDGKAKGLDLNKMLSEGGIQDIAAKLGGSTKGGLGGMLGGLFGK